MAAEKSVGRPGWGAVGVAVLILFSFPFFAHSILRGFALGDVEEQATSRLFSADLAANFSMYGHMIVGGLLTALAPLQLSSPLRRRWPRVHRANGYMVALLALATGIGGLIYIARQGTIGGPLMSAGFALYGLLLMLAAMQTVRFARRRDPRHAAWAGRLVILALGSFFFRVQYWIWAIVVGDVGMAEDFSGAFDRVMTFGFYVPWLVLYEVIRRWRRPRPVAGLAA
ncbi:MAG: DUF2306 domain-containing protein [Pseudomonadota bacterium]